MRLYYFIPHLAHVYHWCTCLDVCPASAPPCYASNLTVAACIFLLNVILAHGGISTTMSHSTTITGLEFDYNKHCRMQPGEYVQTHEETDNTMKFKTVGAIALRRKGNAQGDYYYLSLKTGQRLKRGLRTPTANT